MGTTTPIIPSGSYLIGDKKIFNLNRDEKIKMLVSLMKDDLSSLPKIKKEFEGRAIELSVREVRALKAELTRLLVKKEDGSDLDLPESIDIIRSALTSIPDTILSVKLKSEFLGTYFSEIREHISDVAYDETLPALTIQKMISKITLPEYWQAVKGTNYSDYIVLSIGLLRDTIKDLRLTAGDEKIFKELIDELSIDYFELRYDFCMKKIISCASSLKDKGGAKVGLVCDLIIDAREDCTEVDPDKNDTRRFFGTKLSQYVLGHAGTSEVLGSVDRISRAILKKPITLPAEIENAVSDAISEYSGIGTTLRMREAALKAGSPKYASKDRILRVKAEKEGETEGYSFESRLDEARGDKFSSHEILSTNLGELRSNSPNFRDEITQTALRNRIVDVNRSVVGGSGYSETDDRQRAALVSSISGHAFHTVAVLEEYMLNNPGPTLEKDINNFLLAFVGTYAKRGYHSMHEVLDVLREPNVMKVFSDRGVDLKFLISPSILQKALNDTLAYSKVVSMKKPLLAEMKIQALARMRKTVFEKELKQYHEMLNAIAIKNPTTITSSDYEKVKNAEIILREVARKRSADKVNIEKTINLIDKIHFSSKLETAFAGDFGAEIEKVKKLLLDPFILKNLDSKTSLGNTFITLAAAEGFSDIVNQLIEKGVNKEGIDVNGKTALYLASKKGDIKIVTALIAAGADLGPISGDNSPVACAREQGFIEIVNILEAGLKLRIEHAREESKKVKEKDDSILSITTTQASSPQEPEKPSLSVPRVD